jgi:hypothetical protein
VCEDGGDVSPGPRGVDHEECALAEGSAVETVENGIVATFICSMLCQKVRD